MSQDATTEGLKARMRALGLRATRPRLAVLQVLVKAAAPTSHADVVEALGSAGWDRATLYRNLNDLASAGLLRRLDVDHTWRFELIPEKATDGAHPHFVCVSCGDIQCMGQVEIQAASTAAAALLSRQHEVQIRGVCDDCSV